MNLLAVDTSTSTGGVAVVRDDQVVASLQVTSKKTHTGRLMGAIDTVLKMSDMKLCDCDGHVVTIGPGSFTGLRIGISTVKGLGFATGKPVAGVSTLEVLAYQFPCFPYFICPMLDARKEQVFTALYRWIRDGRWEKVTDEVAVTPRAWLDQLSAPSLFVGEGAVVYRKCIEEKMGDQAMFAPGYLNTIRAAVVAEIGLARFKEGRAVDAAHIGPNYLRPSDAEIKTGNVARLTNHCKKI